MANRGSVREAAFESLSKLLKLHYSETLLESKKETIADGIKKTLRKEGKNDLIIFLFMVWFYYWKIEKLK